MRRKRKAAQAENGEQIDGNMAPLEYQPLSKSVRVLNPKTMLPIIYRVKSIPEQRLRDKIGRDKAWMVGKSYLDREHERFVFMVVQGIELVPKIVTFKEACAMFGWKSFSFEMSYETVIPVWCDKGADEV